MALVWKRLLVIFICLSSLASIRLASADRPTFRTVTEAKKQIVTEQVYRFQQFRYDPPAEVVLSDENNISYRSPEEALVSVVFLMATGNYSAWLNSWTESSRKQMTELDARFNRTPDDWKQNWSRTVRGRKLVLTHRIETGKYVLIEHELVSPGASGPESVLTSLMTFVEEDGKWLATQELKDDPVRQFWRVPETRPRFIVR